MSGFTNIKSQQMLKLMFSILIQEIEHSNCIGTYTIGIPKL